MTDTVNNDLIARLNRWAIWLDSDIGSDKPAGDDCREAASLLSTLAKALEDSQSLLVAMLHEQRSRDEIEAQIAANRSAMKAEPDGR